jgi:protein-tyrosine phosphatase
LIISDGPASLQQRATTVRITGSRWEIVIPGAVSADVIAGLAPCRILFVCTGNTCRSPLAQALCTKLLADHLSCLPLELPQRGFIVQSAGLAAMMGESAADEARIVAQECGADLSAHRSQPLTIELLTQADFLFAMTRSHLFVLESLETGPPPRLLSLEGDDIPDPIGSPPEVYRACARRILGQLEKLLPELVQP